MIRRCTRRCVTRQHWSKQSPCGLGNWHSRPTMSEPIATDIDRRQWARC